MKAGDFWGGLAAMLVALPQSMAFGIVVFATLDPSFTSQGAFAGAIGAAAVGIFAPIFGGTPRLISSPCAPAAAFLGGILTEVWIRDSGVKNPAEILFILTLIIFSAGLFQLVFSFIQAGKIIKFIPFPVVTGYLSAVAIVIFLGQLPRFAGIAPSTSLWQMVRDPSIWNPHALLIGSATVVCMFLAPKLSRKIPAPIIGLGGGVAVFSILSIFHPEYRSLENNKLLIGALQGDFSMGNFLGRFDAVSRLDFNILRHAIVAGATLAVILSIDTLKSCVIVDTLTRSRSNTNRELLGQGAGNIMAALTGGIAGAGTLGATLVNISSGGQTRLSGALSGIFSLLALIVLSPLIAWVPVSALAGILILVAFRMIDWHMFSLLTRRATILDFLVIVTVIVTALNFSLMTAAIAGFALSVVFFLREQMRGSVIRRKSCGNEMSSKKSRLPSEIKALREQGRRIIMYELQGSLFFGNTDRLFMTISDDIEDAQFIILSMRRVQSVDFTAVHMFEQIQSLLDAKRGRLLLSDLTNSLSAGMNIDKYLSEAGFVKPGNKTLIFDESFYAIEWAEDYILDEKKLYRSHREGPLELPEIEMFHTFSPERLMSLRSHIVEKSFKEGDTVFRAGDDSDEIYFIRRGQVKIMLALGEKRSMHLATFGAGDFFGDMSFVDYEPRSADAIALTPADLFSLSRIRFEKLTMEDPELGKEFYASLARYLAQRFRATHMELRALE